VTTSWTQQLWQAVEPTYQAILEHPFLQGLTDGSLPQDRFAYYVAQDAHYLRDYARALAVVGAKAPTHADTGVLAKHAVGTVDVELALHEALLPRLGLSGVDLENIPISPTTTAYTSYLLATVYGSSFAQGLAAVLPCYWIYARVGEALVERGSPDERYSTWIDTYAGDEFAAVVAEVLTLADRIGPDLSESEKALALQHFCVTSQYEWMFWDAAWRTESWPLAGAGAVSGRP
jgi:thiaminase (transcriptional activator TenA)